MRENDHSPDLNTLHLDDYERIVEKKANQYICSENCSPFATWNHFPHLDDLPSIPDNFLTQTFGSTESPAFLPDLGYFHGCSSSMFSTDPSLLVNHESSLVSPSMTQDCERSFPLSIFTQARSLSTSPELHTPPESGTDATAPKDSKPKSAKDGVPRHKRPSHINAEHRRRSKIQRCLDELKGIVPSTAETSISSASGSSGGKKSKASLLVRTAGYCRQLKADCRELQKEADALRTELQSLSAEINAYHMELPADGIQGQVTAAVSTRQMFNDYVQTRTAANWKFWIFGLFVRPLFESYDSSVITTDKEKFCQSLLMWLKDHCNLLTLRKAIHSAIFNVGRQTSVISSPENLPKEAVAAAIKDFGGRSENVTAQTTSANENALQNGSLFR